MFANTVIQKVLTIVTFFVLARLLKPADYGVMSVLFIISGAADRFTTHGLDSALIQRGGEVESYLDDLWTLNVLKALGLFFIIYFLGGYLSDYFHVHPYTLLVSLAGLFVLIPNFANTRQIYFFKNLDFRSVFLRDISGQIAYVCMALGWALFISASVWSLFYAQIVRLIVTTIATFVLYPRMPRFRLRISKLRSLFHYSKWISGKTILDYFLGIIDTLFVGRLLDPAALGAYSKADSLSSVVTEPMTSIISKVGFPAYSRVQDDLGKIQDGFMKSLDVLITLAVPVCVLLLLEGGTLVSVFLGQRWLVMVLPLKVLSFSALFFAVAKTLSPLFDSIGRPDINFKSSVVQLVASPALLYFGTVQYGTVGSAWAMLLLAFVVLCFMVISGRSLLKMGKDRFMPTIIPVAVSTLTVLILELFFRFFVRATLPDPAVLIWVIFLGCIYIVSLLWVGSFFKSGPHHTLTVILKELKLPHSIDPLRELL